MTKKTRRFRFNEKTVPGAPVPADGRVFYQDDKAAGLELQVTATGSRTFYYRHGDRRKLLGRYPDVSVGEARDAADRLRGEVARGTNPFADSPGRRGSPTLDAFFDDWLERHGRPFRPRTVAQDEHLYRKHISPALGKTRLVDIDRNKVQKLHAIIKRDAGERKTGPAGAGAGNRTANRMLQLVSIMFNCARQWGLYHEANPTEGIRRFKEAKRERYLTLEEAPRFFAALADPKTPADTRDFIMLALFTGARRGNLMAMRWADVDLTAAVWTVPAAAAKTGRAYHIPLVGPAVEILAQRQRAAVPGYPWIFPANSASGHLIHPQKQWDEFKKRAGLDDLRLHDLRHSLASWMVGANVSLAIAGKALGHNSVSTTQRYAHLADAPVRGAMSGAVAALLQAGGFGLAKIEEPKKGAK